MPRLLQFLSVMMCFSGSFVAAYKCVDAFQWLFRCSLWVCGCVSVALLLQFVECVGVSQWLFCFSLWVCGCVSVALLLQFVECVGVSQWHFRYMSFKCLGKLSAYSHIYKC